MVTTPKDIVGGVLQSWLEHWMKKNNFQFTGGVHTQSWPDFILSDGSHLEVKTFDGSASPNFDVANFDAYTRSIMTHPERLDTDHLIFEYIAQGGQASIRHFWVKKIWEMTGPSDTNIINLQVKQGVPVNIRPKNWRSPQVVIFQNRRQFVCSLARVLDRYYPDRYPNWFTTIETEYLRKTGAVL